jgi:hypothetical protein
LTVCIIEAKLWTAFFSGYQDIARLMRFKDFCLGVKQNLFWTQNMKCIQYHKNGTCPGAQLKCFGDAKYEVVSSILKMEYIRKWVRNFNFPTVEENIYKVEQPSTGYYQE